MSIATDFIWIRFFLFHSPNSDPHLCFLRDSTNEAQNHFYWRPNCQTFNQEMEFFYPAHGVMLNVQARTDDRPLVEGL